jgi:hypothetical protein
MTPVEVTRVDEAWTTIELANGTVIRGKIVVLGVALVEGLKDPFGNPAYQISSQTVMGPAVPGKIKLTN